MTAALAAIAALDDGYATATDRALADRYDLACQQAQTLCLICGSDGGPECTGCVIAAEVWAKRMEDQ